MSDVSVVNPKSILAMSLFVMIIVIILFSLARIIYEKIKEAINKRNA